jgi:hypothetical protein
MHLSQQVASSLTLNWWDPGLCGVDLLQFVQLSPRICRPSFRLAPNLFHQTQCKYTRVILG